jgi:hypothetical protein
VHEFLLQGIQVEHLGQVVGKFGEMKARLLRVDISPSADFEGLYDVALKARVEHGVKARHVHFFP